MIITSNTIITNFSKAKTALAVGGYQCAFQMLKACRTTTNVASFVLGKAIKIPFLFSYMQILYQLINKLSYSHLLK